ncbi:hypothetical protein [Allofranklinella schreckenbergeri]|nr:hypothetical protein [Allofranklinella schreckenbergeri]
MSYSSHSPEERLQRMQTLFPGSALYLKNKWRGGHNGRKGTDYERLYAAFALAQVLVRYCMLPRVERWPAVYEQVEAAVDDLLVETADGARYHQLKNVQDLSWGRGEEGSVHADFMMQKSLSDALEERGSTVLVVANLGLADKLKRTLPENIEEHTEVEFFPFCDGSINRLIFEHHPLREILAQLSITSSPDLAELGFVYSALAAAFMHSDKGGRVDELLMIAQEQSPQLIRLLPEQAANIKIKDELKNILREIPDFRFSIERGFFEWSRKNDSGVLKYSCLTPQFDAFQKMIIQANPKTFEQLEEFLL